MKLLLPLLLLLSVLLVVATGPAAAESQHRAHSSFHSFMRTVSTHASFQRLTNEEQLLFGELVLSAENDELHDFVHRVGLDRVLELVKHMSDADAKIFADYLVKHMGYLAHSAEWTKLQHWAHSRPGDDDDDDDDRRSV